MKKCQMCPEIAFKCIFRLMAFVMILHLMVYMWAIFLNDRNWCPKRITNKSVYFDSSPPYTLWNYTWEIKEVLWCGL